MYEARLRKCYGGSSRSVWLALRSLSEGGYVRGEPRTKLRDRYAGDHEALHRQQGVLYKSGVYARKALCLTPGGLSCALPLGGAEGRVIDPDRMGAAVALQAMAGQGSQSRLLRDGRRA